MTHRLTPSRDRSGFHGACDCGWTSGPYPERSGAFYAMSGRQEVAADFAGHVAQVRRMERVERKQGEAS